jgi:PAS domain S-box-containing protein
VPDIRDQQPKSAAQLTSALARFLVTHRDAILQAWETHARRRPKAEPLSRDAIRDHVPRLLEHIVEQAEHAAHGDRVANDEGAARQHAMQRLGLGFSVGEMTGEYSLLRSAIWLAARQAEVVLDLKEVALLDAILDSTIQQAVVTYSRVQQQTLVGLNQISEAAFETDDVEGLLNRLSEVFRAAVEGVDHVEILLHDRDEVVPRAKSGARESAPTEMTSRDELASRVASTRRPEQWLASSQSGHDVRDARGLQAMYAVPLLRGEELLGVAIMGAADAAGFSEEHRALFGVLAERATMLVDRARTRARERATAEVTHALSAATTLDQAVKGLLQVVGEHFGWDTGAFWRFDPSSHALRFHSYWSRENGPYARFWNSSVKRLAHDEGLPGKAWSSGSIVWRANIIAEPNFPRHSDAAAVGLQTALAFPIPSDDGKILGVLEFFTCRRRNPAEEGVYLTGLLAAQLPAFIRRISATERIRESQARMAAMQDTSLDAIVGMNANGEVTLWNPAAERIFGYSRAAALGKNLASLIIPERLRDAHHRGLARYLRTGAESYMNRRIETPAVDASGREFPVELVITRLMTSGVPEFAGTIRDVSERKRDEAERQRLLENAQRATELRDQLLAVVSHDLRNPMNTIVMSSALIERSLASSGVEDAVATRAVRTIARAADQMSRLIGDLLDVAIMQSGRFTIDLNPERLCTLISDAIDLHRVIAQDKGVVMTVENVDSNVLIAADRARLIQVLSNLLGNAIKFCRKGDTIDVRGQVRGPSACVIVSDSGPGVQPDMLPHIFEPHWAGKGPAKGTGLGLFISQRIVEAHGGTLTAESVAGQGATFTFCLPRLTS